jgi:hypothetical protein
MPPERRPLAPELGEPEVRQGEKGTVDIRDFFQIDNLKIS